MHPRRGFTLLEVLLSAAILSVITLAVVQAVAVGQQHTLDALGDGRATFLAEATLEEVLALPYTDPGGDTAAGPDAGESGRDDFDAMDDYHGWSQAAGALTVPSGAAYPTPYQGYSRSVTVVYETVTIAGLGGDHTGLTITVTVTDGGRAFTISRFVAEPVS